jgi:SAM-dependent methyltransferase
MNTGNTRSTSEATRSWERFAELDPYLYILTTMKRRDFREFWLSGEQTVQAELLPIVQSNAVRPEIGLEVGSGIGRLTFPLARHFETVVGVDVARGMVERATSLARHKGIQNVSFSSITGPEDFLQHTGNYAGTCNFIYSLLVFQHIPDLSVIEGYLHVIRILLHEQGLAYLQFDTRPKNLAYRLKTSLPDGLLPRFWRRGIRRIRRSPEEIETSIRRAGLKVVAELTPRSAYHRYLLRRPQCPRGTK